MAGVLAGKVAVITGAGRGIGRAVAVAYAREGAALALCSRTGEELRSTAAEGDRLGAKVLALPTDVSQLDEAVAFVDAALKTFGRLDVLVNNAGVAHAQVGLLECPVEEWDRVLAVNLRGAYLVARAVAPHMVRQRRGSIINVSSWLGRDTLNGWGAYGVSKWGLEGLTRYLALELKPSRVRVNSVSPGYVATKMTNYGGAQPESVVDLFVYLASDASNGLTGQALDVETWRRELGIRRKEQ
ncbi:MAG: SDR family oxidoreductase [Candidatus Rokubacteria bacterium]|nr:SDR family oxidoreductase [Candidatus Rokubacteria bacterium]